MTDQLFAGEGLLLVDPDSRVRLALRSLATTMPLLVCGEAADVDGALIAVRRSRPRVAVVEPLLPTLSAGSSLIRELTVAFRIRVIALSTQTGLASAALDAGADEFLVKDCTPEVLLRALNRCASGPAAA